MSNILTERSGRVGIIRLNRPKFLNALSNALVDELLKALQEFDDDPEVGAIVLTGSDTAFCAGADIKEQKELTFVQAYTSNYLKNLNDGLGSTRKPIIGVINGYALGGGCELAMMCDILYAGDKAKFGQPEIKLGTIPGAGGTQRLIRAVGKAKAMHMILTGDMITASEAEVAGLIAKVLPADQVFAFAVETAQKIAGFSAPVVAMAKEAVNEAEESSLQNGLHFERRLYHSTFALQDHDEGFGAYLGKREPQWTNK